MKKFIIAILAVVMLSGACIAQDVTKNIVFMGGRYDKVPVLSFGYATPIDGNLWSFSYVDAGQFQALNTEVAYLFSIDKTVWIIDKIYIGPIAGPNAEWYGANTDDNVPTINYIVGAAGGLLALDISPTIGAWGYGKYKFTFQEDNMYKDGFAVGLGLFYRF